MEQREPLSLNVRPASVTIVRDEAVDEPARARDSLEETRKYYNVSPPPRTRIASLGSVGASSARPASYAPSEHSVRSPARPSIPLPPASSRAFLAPQKPAAARRLEQQRARRESSSDAGGPGPSRAASGSAARSARSSYVASEETHESAVALEPIARAPAEGSAGGRELSLAAMLEEPPAVARAVDVEDDVPPEVVPWDDHGNGARGAYFHGNGARSGTIRTATDASTPPRRRQPLPELSSDHLMGGGASVNETVEKGPGRPKSTPNSAGPRPPGPGVRRYKTFANESTKWFLAGHAMTGGDSPASLAMVVVVLLGITGVWLGTTGAWLWVHGNEYGLVPGGGIGVVVVFVYLFGITVSSMLAAAFRDPGIIPRDLDTDPPYSQVESWWEADPREVRVGETRMQVKYCETCRIYRPPRCSHCRVCGNCVDGIDHHCSYLHTCVGKRNYVAFLAFVVFAAISAIYIVVFSAVHFALLCHHDAVTFRAALQGSPGAAVSFLLGVLVLPGILFLLWYHVRLLLYNLTTIEKIRASASRNLFRATKRPDTPFTDRSIARNIVRASLGRPQFPSWVDAAGWAEPDTRAVNPALTTPEKYLELV
ncbi:Eukaryotic peptide chain release factor GTP-binding subunit [Cryptotrichosporon argae]